MPGLTGLAQIHADRDIPRRHKFRYDGLYISRRTFWLDLRLIVLFRGDMSFVGPRALMPEEIEVNGAGEAVPIETIPGYVERHRVVPGLTGVAQVYADRDVPRRRKFRYDRLYITKQSFWLDVRLIALSFWITFRGAWERRGGKL